MSGRLNPTAQVPVIEGGDASVDVRVLTIFGPDRPARATSPERLATWLVDARRGEACVYFRGHLQVARSPRNVMRHERQCAAALGSAACDAERRGLVHLIQRRHGPDDYSYLMIRTGLAAPASRKAGNQ